MDNALSYTPQGGKILLLLSQSAHHTIFAVADDGSSIPEEEKAHILNAFIARTMHILTTITLVWAYAQHRKSFVHITERFWYTIPVTALRCLKVSTGSGRCFTVVLHG